MRDSFCEDLKRAHEAHRTYGAVRVNRMLRAKYGLRYSDRYAKKCWRWLGIKAEAHGVRYRKPKCEKELFPRLVFGGGWRPGKPFMVVASDMTMLRNRNGKTYEVTFYFDAFDRSILSCRWSTRAGDARPYVEGLKEVARKRKKERIDHDTILHTDQGSVYSSHHYNQLAKELGLVHSMSRAGTPTDNPMDEALNGWIKDEIYTDFGFYRSENPEKCLRDFTRYWNTSRLFWSLDYKTPTQRRAESGL